MSTYHLPHADFGDGTCSHKLFENHHATVCSYRDVDATSESFEKSVYNRWGGQIWGEEQNRELGMTDKVQEKSIKRCWGWWRGGQEREGGGHGSVVLRGKEKNRYCGWSRSDRCQ